MTERSASDFGSLLKFVEFTHQFQQVNRVVLVNGEDRWENDAEHSFQLALIGWFIVQLGKLDLDVYKVLGMALVHDLPEAYAGDTYIYDPPEILATKAKREREAIELMRKNFPQIPSIHELIAEYGAKVTSESCFVYALDKLVPIFDIYLDEGRTWQQKGITLDQLIKAKTDKIALSTEIVPYYEQILEIVQQNPQLFSSPM